MIKNKIQTEKNKFLFLFFATIFVIFFFLGAKELWTQEWRWVNIPFEMLLRHDYLHPYLAGSDYYDKPLLSYWLILFFSYMFGGLKLWVARLPSALSGLVVVYCTYKLGRLNNHKIGYYAAWLLISTGAFIFWARVASTDMLNLAGIMLAVTWYFYNKNKNNFLTYFIFFFILAFFSLCKGLSVCAIVFLALLPEVLLKNNIKQHINLKCIFAILVAIFIYLIPFWLSSHYNLNGYRENGLYEVLRENFIRYINPFDHLEPFYVYFIYLPIYTFPWIIFLIPACIYFFKTWRNLSEYSKWYLWVIFIIFIFLTFSGSRRNYYTLPLVPFVVLAVTNWMILIEQKYKYFHKIFIATIASFFTLITLYFCILIPVYYSDGGLQQFGTDVRFEANKIQEWNKWHITILNVKSQSFFYLHPVFLVKFDKNYYHDHDAKNYTQLIKSLPILKQKNKNNIFILKYKFVLMLQQKCQEQKGCLLKNYKLIFMKPSFGDRVFKQTELENPVALIPR